MYRRATVRVEPYLNALIRECVAQLSRGLLIMHSPVDEAVDVDHVRKLFEEARHPKSFVSLDSADHLLRRHEDAAYAAKVLAAWVERYIGPVQPEPILENVGFAVVSPLLLTIST